MERDLLSSYELATGCMPDPERSKVCVLPVEVLKEYHTKEEARTRARMDLAFRDRTKVSRVSVPDVQKGGSVKLYLAGKNWRSTAACKDFIVPVESRNSN